MNWTKRAFYRNYAGEPCEAKDAVAACIIGHLRLREGWDELSGVVGLARFLGLEVSGYRDALTMVMRWNDREEESVVRRVFEDFVKGI